MADAEQLSTLAVTFLNHLPASLKMYVVDELPVILRVPAKDADVGDLVVHDDRIELTVEIGNISHSHIDTYSTDSNSQSEREMKAAVEAVDYVDAIIGDRVKMRCEYQAGRLLSVSEWDCRSVPGDRGWLLDVADEAREYTWSGKTRHEFRTAVKQARTPLLQQVRDWWRSRFRSAD